MADAPAAAPPSGTPPSTTPPPAATPPNKEPETVFADPTMSRVLADLGWTQKDGKLEKAPEQAQTTAPSQQPQTFITMGEAARFKAEKASSTPPPKPATTPSAAQAAATPPPDSPPAATPPPASATPTPADKPKITVEKGQSIEEIVEGIMKRTHPAPASTPTASAPDTTPAKSTAPDPDEAYIEKLAPKQKKVIEICRFAAESEPKKYGTLTKQMVDYLKKVDEHIAAKMKEDPDWDPKEDEEFEEFCEENNPLPEDERDRLNEERIASVAERRVEARFKPQMQEAEKATRRQQVQPIIDSDMPRYRTQVAGHMAEDEKSPLKAVMAKAVEKGLTEEAWNEAAAIDPLAAAIGKTYTEDATNMGKLYLEMATGVREQVAYLPDLPYNSPHNKEAILQGQLFQFIATQERTFYEKGGNLRVLQDGRTFLPRSEFYKLSDSEKNKHWTLQHGDVMNMISDNAEAGARAEYENEVQRRQKEGFTRNGKAQTPPAETPPPATPAPGDASPKATLTPSPGAASPTPPAQPPPLFSKDQFDRMIAPGARQWAN